MKSSKFTFLQQCIQRQRRAASNITFESPEEEKISPQRKEFLDKLEKLKRDIRGDKK